MAYVAPTDDIIWQEGTGGFSLTAGATVKKGQALYLDGTLEAIPTVTANDSKFIGIAAFDQTDGKKLTVYGPGNIVRVIAESAVAVGAAVGTEGTDSKFGDASVSRVAGIALEAATLDAAFRMLLV